MADAVIQIPKPVNEPIRQYEPGNPFRTLLKNKLDSMSKDKIDIPCFIGGREIRTNEKRKVVMPHSHREVVAEFCYGGPSEMTAAIEACKKAKKDWENLSWDARAAVFLKAADLIAGPYRDTINAATMLGQSKNAYQSEIDAACELIDFLRFNAYFYEKILQDQPISSPGIWNQVDYRPLEGFILAIAPFNFTAISGNLCSAPAMMGNAVIWKPSDTQMLAAYYTYKIFEEAGLPPGVINLVPADGPTFGKTLLPHENMAGVHFTGSTATFRNIWKTVGDNVSTYKSYPRIVGETGGKDFVFVHPSADVDAVAANLIRGAFEFQGQKCSAASRAYVPNSLWKKIWTKMEAEMNTIQMGDVRDFRNFVNAVIDQRAFDKISGYIAFAKTASDAKILKGGKVDGQTGYFIEPTVIQTTNPSFKTMVEEIFGPVLTVYVYDDAKMDDTLEICEKTSPYGLTGAIFCQDTIALEKMVTYLRHAAGNMYVNDKPTGAVVGQQPFGGARASGTNDKAGSGLNLIRWLSPRTIKRNLVPPKDYRYPFMLDK
jgi:1-pyrroline-5-carboxylate dehydrogenase